jgi:hypothetical protein
MCVRVIILLLILFLFIYKLKEKNWSLLCMKNVELGVALDVNANECSFFVVEYEGLVFMWSSAECN